MSNKIKIKYTILKSWECEATTEDGTNKMFVGIQFTYNNQTTIHTIFLLKEDINTNKIKNAIKDYYKQTITKDNYANITGEFEPDED